MSEKAHPKTLETFLEEYAGAELLARDIDRAMLSRVLLLKYEKEQLEPLESYEILYVFAKSNF